MEAEPVSDAAPLAVFGAGGKTGTEILRHAVRKGMEVRAFEHTLPEPSDRVDNVEYLQCDVLNDDFSSELEGCRAVISALGIGFSPSTAIDPPPLYTEGTRKLVEAMSTTGMSRIVVISAAFVEPQPSVPAWFELTARSALHNILEQMRAMDQAGSWTNLIPVKPSLPTSALSRVAFVAGTPTSRQPCSNSSARTPGSTPSPLSPGQKKTASRTSRRSKPNSGSTRSTRARGNT